MSGGKRQATSDINRDNWDREDEPEERGTFRTAPEEELRNRVIKKARRTATSTGSGNEETDGSGGGTSVFRGFAGFGKTGAGPSSMTPSSSPFSFLSKMPIAPKTSDTIVASTSSAVQPMPVQPLRTQMKITEPYKEKSMFYYAKVKSLNQGVSEWIKIHVDKNPLCILTPIFKDYEKHLQEIEMEEENASKTTATPVIDADSGPKMGLPLFSGFKFTTSTATSAPPSTAIGTNATCSTFTTTSVTTTSFTPAQPASALSGAPAQSTPGTFSFGSSLFSGATTKNGFGSDSAPKPAFAFSMSGASSSQSDAPKPFSFGSPPAHTGFTFGNLQPPPIVDGPSTSKGKVDEEENDEPPKVEFKPVVEDDAIYSKKCKLFIKKDGTFSDRGVGTLYLKPIKDSTRAQLLVRADTSLGNILVNIVLSTAIPAQRMGKNNVMLVCLPTPDIDKPTPILLRVKTSVEADELLAIIEKHKN